MSETENEQVHPLKEQVIRHIAKKEKRQMNDICCICGIPIKTQIFRNSGVCCEDHRKDRDNDHLPFRGGYLAP